MTLDSARVTDTEFATLVRAFGERDSAAMVLLIAYSNFQDRLLLCLASPLESDGPRSPLDFAFGPGALESRMLKPSPSRLDPLPQVHGQDVVQHDAEWSSVAYDDLQARMDEQRHKPTRLRVSEWDEVA
jgi:hypothetical protein